MIDRLQKLRAVLEFYADPHKHLAADEGIPDYYRETNFGLNAEEALAEDDRLATLPPQHSSGDARERAVTVAKALFEFERSAMGGRRGPAWELQLPEFREHMVRKALVAIEAALGSQDRPAPDEAADIDEAAQILWAAVEEEPLDRVRAAWKVAIPEREHAREKFRRCVRLILASRSAPDGWVLVPRLPTPEMVEEGKIHSPAAAFVYSAMLAASQPRSSSSKSRRTSPARGQQAITVL